MTVIERAAKAILEKSGYLIAEIGKNTTIELDYSVEISHGRYNGKLMKINQDNVPTP